MYAGARRWIFWGMDKRRWGIGIRWITKLNQWPKIWSPLGSTFGPEVSVKIGNQSTKSVDYWIGWAMNNFTIFWCNKIGIGFCKNKWASNIFSRSSNMLNGVLALSNCTAWSTFLSFEETPIHFLQFFS